MDAIVSGYADHLTEADLRLLSAVAPAPGGTARLARDPAGIEARLADPRVFDAVFGSAGVAAGEAVLVSPFLAFGVAVHRAVTDLSALDYLPERSGLRQRVPVFDTPELRDFLDSAARRLFLAELLASFTRVASGRYRVQSAGRSRTRRFSELDPVRLAGLLEAMPEESRPGIYRRLGDVSLFLAGVFPDYAASNAIGPVDAGRLLRAARVPSGERDGLAAARCTATPKARNGDTRTAWPAATAAGPNTASNTRGSASSPSMTAGSRASADGAPPAIGATSASSRRSASVRCSA